MQSRSYRTFRGGGASVLSSPIAASRRGARQAGPRIAALAVSDSETVLTQEQVLDRLGLAEDEFATRIFGRCWRGAPSPGTER